MWKSAKGEVARPGVHLNAALFIEDTFAQIAGYIEQVASALITHLGKLSPDKAEILGTSPWSWNTQPLTITLSEAVIHVDAFILRNSDFKLCK